MTDLSPAAQAVVNAAVDVTGYGKETPLLKTRLAAALEALTEQLGYELLGVRVVDCSQILAIAAELRQ